MLMETGAPSEALLLSIRPSVTVCRGWVFCPRSWLAVSRAGGALLFSAAWAACLSRDPRPSPLSAQLRHPFCWPLFACFLSSLFFFVSSLALRFRFAISSSLSPLSHMFFPSPLPFLCLLPLSRSLPLPTLIHPRFLHLPNTDCLRWASGCSQRGEHMGGPRSPTPTRMQLEPGPGCRRHKARPAVHPLWDAGCCACPRSRPGHSWGNSCQAYEWGEQWGGNAQRDPRE